MKKILLLIMVLSSLKGEFVKSSEIIDECNDYLQKADEFMEKSIKYANKTNNWTIADTYSNISRILQERYKICVVKLHNKE